MVSAIWTRFLCHFQNGALHFCATKTGKVIKHFVNFNPFYMGFAKMALVTIYMLLSLKTGSHFFTKEPDHQLKMCLGLIIMVNLPKNADMCPILGNFPVPLVRSLSNTNWACTGS